MPKNISSNVKPISVQILLWAIVLFVGIDGLSKFGVFDLTAYVSPVLIPTVASFFILSEIGIMQLFKGRKKLDALQSFGLVIGVLGIISVAISLFGLAVPTFMAIQGILSFGLGLYAVVEIFKK